MKFLLSILCLFSSTFAMAASEFPAQGRIYIGMTQTEPKELNTELTAMSLDKVDGVTFYGAEILFPVMKIFDVGLRYTKHLQRNEEEPNNAATEYYSEIDQDAVAAVLRIAVIRTSILRVEAFAGYGGSNTTVTLKNASQDGSLEKKDSGSWLAEPYSVFGAAVGLGYKQVYFVMEAGYESNKVEGFKKTGSVTANVPKLDMSGTYFSVGVLFDGIKATK